VQLSVNTFVSLDSVMQGPGGVDEDPSGRFDRGGWLVPYADADMGRVVEQEWFAHADAILLGRNTYQVMYPYWSSVTDPENTVGVALNTLPKYVVSSTMAKEDAPWDNSSIISDRVVERIRELKDEPGRELQVHGSWQLIRALHEADLIDTYRLLVFPVVVGAGKRLFDDASTPASFEVTSADHTGVGVSSLILRRRPFQTGGLAVEDGREVAEA
jgi:dihydrofolate reductase